MRRTIIAASVAALSLALAVPASAARPGFAGPDNGSTIVGTAVALSGGGDFDEDPDDFDILVQAVLATGTQGVLDGSTDYTVFAPTDQAFLDLAGIEAGEGAEEATFDALVELLGVDGVASVLAYHVTEGWRPSPSVVNARKITMLDGNTISARGGTITAIGSTAGFVAPAIDVRTTDGGIHVIDAVLLPFVP